MKINTSAIEGYADMTAEQKLAALESYEIPDPDYTGYVKKDVLDKAAHDAAEWKRKFNATLSDAEKAANEQAEKQAAKDQELQALRTELNTNRFASKYIAMGYSEELAQSTAEALAKGDMQTVFDNQNQFLESVKKNAKAEAMRSTPRTPVGRSGIVPEVDYHAKAEEAAENGNAAEAIRLIREEFSKSRQE